MWPDASCPVNYALVKVDDASEQAFLAARAVEVNGEVDHWIGGSDRGTPGEYRWVADNTLMPTPGSGGYHNWGGGLDRSGDCVEMDGDASSGGARWTWNDASCSQSQHYICESTL